MKHLVVRGETRGVESVEMVHHVQHLLLYFYLSNDQSKLHRPLLGTSGRIECCLNLAYELH